MYTGDSFSINLLIFIYCSFIAKPIGLYFGIKDGKPKVVQPISALENSYKVKKFPSEETIKVCLSYIYPCIGRTQFFVMG